MLPAADRWNVHEATTLDWIWTFLLGRYLPGFHYLNLKIADDTKSHS